MKAKHVINFHLIIRVLLVFCAITLLTSCKGCKIYSGLSELNAMNRARIFLAELFLNPPMRVSCLRFSHVNFLKNLVLDIPRTKSNLEVVR